MNLDKNKMAKSIGLLLLLCILVAGATQITKNNSLTLSDYAAEQESSQSEILQTDITESESSESVPPESEVETHSLQDDLQNSGTTSLVGASLNGEAQLAERTTYTDFFYYEPLSDNLCRYITGVSYPSEDASISYEELRYLHILHYDFEGNPAAGELICNQAIAQDLVEIFYELYRNEYRLEKVRLIDEYDGNDDASMADNNSSCFNYRNVSDSASLSKHALGLAIDINPLYNPYITYNEDGSKNIAPIGAEVYADRENSFPYKITEDDLCYKLFTQYGFTWGGNWNSCKDYQHFQKSIN